MSQSGHEPETASDKGALFIRHPRNSGKRRDHGELTDNGFYRAGKPRAAVEAGPARQQDGGIEFFGAGVESVGAP